MVPGGNNAHLLIEEYDASLLVARDALLVNQPPCLIVLSAKTEERLKAVVNNLKEHLTKNELRITSNEQRTTINNIAYTLQQGRDAMESKIAFIASSREQWLHQAEEFLQKNQDTNQLIRTTYHDSIDAKVIKSLVSTAKKWLNKEAVSWDSTENHIKPSRLHLPGYPFDLKQYQLQQPALKTITKQQAIHPFLGNNCSDLDFS